MESGENLKNQLESPCSLSMVERIHGNVSFWPEVEERRSDGRRKMSTVV